MPPVIFSLPAVVLLFCAIAPFAQAEPKEFVFAEGSPYASPGFIIEGPNPGPTVLITASVNRKDTIGSQYLEALRDTKVLSGKVMVLPEYLTPRQPQKNSGIRRSFPRMPGDPIALDSAQILWEQLQELNVDYLIEVERATRQDIRSATKDRDDYGNTVF